MHELDHIALIVSKEENLKFYEKLGFEEVNRFTRSCDTVVLLQCDEIKLEIFIDSKHPERAVNPENLGLRHIALRVDDFEKIVEEFESEPIRIDFFGIRFTFVKDPDGQPIELKEKIS
jgi:glyoxylase I family protein